MSQIMSNGISNAKSAIQLAGLILDSYKSMDDIQYKLKMTELTNMIIDIRDAINEAREENIELREKYLVLEKRLALAEELEFDGSKYWRKKETGDKEGPFCQKCQDKDAKKVWLIKDSNEMGVFWNCIVCKVSYDYKSPPFQGHTPPSSGWT